MGGSVNSSIFSCLPFWGGIVQKKTLSFYMISGDFITFGHLRPFLGSKATGASESKPLSFFAQASPGRGNPGKHAKHCPRKTPIVFHVSGNMHPTELPCLRLQ
jgi:hypothetical protein